MYILYAGINGANPRYIERPAIKTACQELTQMKSFGSPEIGGIDRTSEKNNIDCRNYFSDFNIYRQRICSYKSWTSKCRICRSTKDLDYDMFRILSKRKITFTKIFQISNGNTFPKTQKNLNPPSEKPKAPPAKREKVAKNRPGVGRVWRLLEGLSTSWAKRRQLYDTVEVAATCEDTAA